MGHKTRLHFPQPEKKLAPPPPLLPLLSPSLSKHKTSVGSLYRTEECVGERRCVFSSDGRRDHLRTPQENTQTSGFCCDVTIGVFFGDFSRFGAVIGSEGESQGAEEQQAAVLVFKVPGVGGGGSHSIPPPAVSCLNPARQTGRLSILLPCGHFSLYADDLLL